MKLASARSSPVTVTVSPPSFRSVSAAVATSPTATSPKSIATGSTTSEPAAGSSAGSAVSSMGLSPAGGDGAAREEGEKQHTATYRARGQSSASGSMIRMDQT